jgi:hypothetical protein
MHHLPNSVSLFLFPSILAHLPSTPTGTRDHVVHPDGLNPSLPLRSSGDRSPSSLGRDLRHHHHHHQANAIGQA